MFLPDYMVHMKRSRGARQWLPSLTWRGA